MKIIAHAAHGEIIVQMTDRELANIVGKNYPTELIKVEHYTRTEGTEIGTEYKIADAWRRLQRQAAVAQQLEGVSKTLSALSDLVTQTKVAYTDCVKEGGAV